MASKMRLNYLVLAILVTGGYVAGQSTIIIPPSDAIGNEGGDATFICGVDFGGGVRAMQWDFEDTTFYLYHDGMEVYPIGQEKYSVEQDGTTFRMTVHDLTSDDAGMYWCRPSGSEAKAQLIISGDTAIIITPPSHETGRLGETAVLSCGVYFGSGERVFLWDFKDTPIYIYNDGNENYPGGQEKYSVEQDGTTFTLTVHDLTFEDSGPYWCRPFGVAADAQLIVLDEPNPYQSLENPTENTTVTFICEADFGASARNEISDDHYPTMRMIYDGDVVGGPVTEIPPEGPINTYRFTQEFNRTVEWTDDGQELLCEISTAIPQVVSTGQHKLNVLYPVHKPTYYPEPEDGKYEVGNTVNCTANGNPTPSYQWQRNGEGNPISGELLHITVDMIGLNNIWTCIASNTVDGKAYEDSVTVEFSVKPANGIITPPNDAVGIIGTTSHFSCQVNFLYAEVMQWEFAGNPVYFYDNGAEVYPGSEDKYSVEKDEMTFTLTVNRLTSDDNGIYACRMFGEAPAYAQLDVIESAIVDPPMNTSGVIGGMAEFICVVNISSEGLIQWEYNDNPLYLFVNGKESFFQDEDKYSVEQDGTTFKLTVNDLTVNDGGQYSCRVVGETPAWATLFF